MHLFSHSPLLFLLFAFSGQPPKTNLSPQYSITIRLNSATSFQQHTAYVINGKDTKTVIEQHINDKIAYPKVTRNKAYPKVLKKKLNLLSLSPEAQYKIWDDVDSLYDIYSRHSVKKIVLSPAKDAAYMHVIDSVYMASEDVFTPKNPRRVLDGLYYQITVRNGNQVKRYHINTPNSTLHPLLSHLLARTSAYFK